MEAVIGALGGFRGVRAELLVALKRSQPMTAHELGEQFGLTANALRRHLKVLEEDGLVDFAREVRGVGAPVYTYSLTDVGEALFPRRYLSVLETALGALQALSGSGAVTSVLETEWQRLADDAGPVVDALPLDERVAMVAELLTANGYMAESVVLTSPEKQAITTLRIHNCALGAIAVHFPEACAVEARVLERLLGVPLVRGAHRLDGGCGRCEYGILSQVIAEQPAAHQAAKQEQS
jgi:DeoR family suf operon transcriptional repressor